MESAGHIHQCVVERGTSFQEQQSYNKTLDHSSKLGFVYGTTLM